MSQPAQLVVGFVISEDFDFVVLTNQLHPITATSCWDGICGTVWTPEDIFVAMARACQERTSLAIPQQYWTKIVELAGIYPDGSHYQLSFLYARANYESIQQKILWCPVCAQLYPFGYVFSLATMTHVRWILEYVQASHKTVGGLVVDHHIIQLAETHVGLRRDAAVWCG